MAITRLGAGAGGSSVGTAVTFNGPNLASSDANTVMVVGVVISVSSNSTSTTCAVTVGGVAATQISLTLAGSGTARNAVGLYYLFNPGSGTKSIVATPGGASTKAQARAQAVAFSGVSTTVGAGQTAAATSHSPTSSATGYVVRMLGNGATLSTPNQTQEYLAGASVGGDGDWACMQSAAGTGDTVSFTCAGTATTPNSVAVSLVPLLSKMETLTDYYATQDAAKWTYSAGASATGGQFTYPISSGNQTTWSANPYDLTGSYAFMQVVQAGNVGNGSVERGTLSLQTTTNSVFAGGSYYYWLHSTSLDFYKPVDSLVGTLTYDAAVHKYWRIRESGGTVFYDTSVDGSSWTNRGSTAVGANLITSMYVGIQAAPGTEPTPGTLIVDNFNATTPPVLAVYDYSVAIARSANY